MRRAASILCGPAANGCSGPRPISPGCLPTGEGETKRLSRAALETLAIVAYHQPVTRAEIEDIRGVAISKGTLDLLLETGWVRLRGRRRAPGRPVTYGTTDAFLIHFGLEAIGDLPGLEELKGAGLFDGRLPQGFGIPQPSDGAELAEDEDPLEDETPTEFGNTRGHARSIGAAAGTGARRIRARARGAPALNRRPRNLVLGLRPLHGRGETVLLRRS